MDKLDELIKNRQEKVRLMKLDGDVSHEILARIYAKPTHFITELLQNAEDEGACNVSIELTENELIFTHDASKLFDFNDIRSISNFGDNQEKKNKPNAIGRFGIGFKSVYSITDSPRIISAEYDITIRDYNIPEKTAAGDSGYFNSTKIILPFKKELRENNRLEQLSDEIEKLNINNLLFLSNISKIKWKTLNGNGVIHKRINNHDRRFVSISSNDTVNNYLVFEDIVPINGKNLKIKIAFLLDENKSKIIACERSPLFVFFPTEIETNLNFLVHAPFYTSPSRENIEEGDNFVNIEPDDRNEELKKGLANLLSNSLLDLKKLKLLNVELLELLPINRDLCRNSIYDVLFAAIKNELCSNKKLLPNSRSGFSSSSDSMLLGSSELVSLITSKQAKQLFGRSNWLSRKITKDKTNLLRDYLYYDIDIPEYDLNKFAKAIDHKFLTTQPDKWFKTFYKVIHKSPSLWRQGSRSNILRQKPIIRIKGTNGRGQIQPFTDDGKLNVFLPTKEKTTYSTVKPNIVKNKNALKFLKDLGLTEPDLFAEINEFILPRLATKESYPQYYDDIKILLKAFQVQKSEKKRHLLDDLKNCPFIRGYNLYTGSYDYFKSESLYFKDADLETYFGKNRDINFVDVQQYDGLNEKEKSQFILLLEEINVKNSLYRIKFDPTFSDEEKRIIRGNYNFENKNSEDFIDFKLIGLESFFSSPISKEKSISLWNLLIRCLNTDGHLENPNKFFKGVYKLNYYKQKRIESFDSYFLKQLRDHAWIYLDNCLYRTIELEYSALPDCYKSEDSESLANFLGFKTDEIKALEKKYDCKMIPKSEYDDFQKFLKEKNRGQEKSDKGITAFVPDVAASEVELKSMDLTITPNKEVKPDLHKTSKNKSGYNISVEEKKNTSTLQQITADAKPEDEINKKEIGVWGEEYVFRELQDEFKNHNTHIIINLNKNGRTGVGADFVIRKGDEDIKLVEVKATTNPFGTPLMVTGTQWEHARYHFDSDAGDKYWIYCVFNACSKDAIIYKIQNPIKLWKEGKLFAHPINFIISDK